VKRQKKRLGNTEATPEQPEYRVTKGPPTEAV
jgi:hypothetical protein